MIRSLATSLFIFITPQTSIVHNHSKLYFTSFQIFFYSYIFILIDSNIRHGSMDNDMNAIFMWCMTWKKKNREWKNQCSCIITLYCHIALQYVLDKLKEHDFDKHLNTCCHINWEINPWRGQSMSQSPSSYYRIIY